MSRNFTRWFLCMLFGVYGTTVWALTQVGGVYQISTAQDLSDFAALVNAGDRTASAVLTSDIDYTGQTTMLGTSSNKFYGILDGQGHTVTVNFTGSEAGTALVQYLGGAVINLHVTGTVTSAFKHAAGVAAYTYGGMVDHCISTVEIVSQMTGDATCAGIVGQAAQSSSVTNCVFAGKIIGKQAENCAGIVGWIDQTTVQNCLAIGDLEINVTAGSAAIARNSAKSGVVENCYALNGFLGTVDEGATLIDAGLVQSGEIAFRLGMGQKLGTDAVPSPLSADKVYATATSCSGEGATGFTNVKGEAQMPEHTFDGYKCSECGALNEEFVVPQEGVYNIFTAEQLTWVAEMVNSGHMLMNVRLTADIDLAGLEEWPMIGSVKFPYRGHMDGQHHVISNLKLERTESSGVGLLSTISGPCVVENLTLDKNCSILGRTHVGLIGHSQGATFITLRGLGNQGSVAAVPPTLGGSGDAGVGGIIGNSPHGCLGQISNCWFTGSIPSGTSCAFISGWTGTNQFSVEGCWGTAEVFTGVNENTCIARSGQSGAGVAIKNCAATYGKQATLITADQVKSGELCYIVNGKDTEHPAWHQTLGTDDMPTLTGTDIVYVVGTKNCDGSIGDGFGYSNTDDGFVQKPHTIDPLTGLCSVCGRPEQAEDGYYLIGTPMALRWVSQQFSSGAATSMDFRLTADIDLDGENWTPIGDDEHPFVGNMDGGRHTISHMIVDTEGVAGLFGTATTANLHDVFIDATCSVRGGMYSGGLIGHTTGQYTSNIERVGTMCDVTCTGSGNNAAAGIIGNANAYNVTNITACFSTGRITSAGDVACISAWQGNVSSKVTNCWTTAEISEHSNYNFCRGGSTTVITGCYCANEYTNGLKANYIGTINADMLATGELCYLVNGSSSQSPVWYQTLEADAVPLPWDDHKVVYAVGSLNCDGTSAGGELTYSNENTSVVPPHKYEEGICAHCGTLDKEYKKPVNGFYELSTPGDILWFSRMVNTVDNTINGSLTSDVDFSDAPRPFEQIGLKVGYSGTFDGRNHRVYNLNIDVDNDDAGFISASNSGMTICNIIFDSTCSFKTTGSWAGVIGVSNWGQTGTTTLQNVGNEGNVTVGGVNAGGLLGGNHDSKGIIVMQRCYTTGQIVSLGRGESAALAGWLGGSSSSRIENCWTTAEVTGQDGAKEAYRGTAQVKNCYSVTGGQFTQFDADEVSTGELTWKLNGKSFLTPQWYQTINEDEYPTWQPKGIVYADGEDSFADVHDEDTYDAFRGYTISSETQRCQEKVADAALLDAYVTVLEGMSEIATMNEFVRAYAAAAPTRQAIQTSEALYQAYDAQAKYALDYIKSNTFECEEAERLEEYLTKVEEPGDNFINGTYLHIMDTHLLNDEAIVAETEFVKTLLSAAIAADYQPGTEITDLMVNANLDAGREGWDIQSTSDSYPRILSVEGVMSAAEAWNCNFTMTQTLKGLKPGVYMLQSNAAFRPGADLYNTFYAGQIVLGKNVNYAMVEAEDAIDKTLAVDGENCNITGTAPDYTLVTEDGDELLVPQGPIGCAYAFNAGRYKNYVAVQIEEGDSLVIGVRNQGTGMERDWMGFGNFHLTYLGTPAEGTAQLATVLNDYLARARTIDEFVWSESVDFTQYPNYAQSIKDDLQATIAKAEKATEGEEMMQLIDHMSDLFQQVYECRVAYIAMAKAAEAISGMAGSFHDQGLFGDNSPELEDMNNMSDKMWGHYSEGTVSAEEALKLANSLYSLSVFPQMVDDCFQLSTPFELKVFSAMVNSGLSSINAMLTADIDMKDENNFLPIGYNVDADNAKATDADKVTYNGVFDGRGHHISNLVIDKSNSVGVGLFGTITAPAEIKNLVLDSNCFIKGYDRVGLIGRSNNAGMVKLDCLGNEGSVEAVYQAPAGIMGNANNGSLANITNCYSAGSIKSGNGKNAAQICGWLGSAGAQITNCWSTAEIEGYDSQDKLFCRYSSNVMLLNCFSTSGDGSQATKQTAEDFASGKIAWMLNGESSDAPVWYQKIGSDLHPVLDASHGIVVKNEDGTYSNDGTALSRVEGTLGQTVAVYDVQGRLVRSAMSVGQALNGLPKGMYILRGTSASRKVMVK